MICPSCGQNTPTFGDAISDLGFKDASRLSIHAHAKALGSLGGRTKGQTKRRAVDYAAMARLSHQKRRENKANQGK